MSLYALRNTGAFLVQSQSVSRGSLFHGISAVSALCGFFLKRRMAAYFRFYNLFWGAKVTVQMRVLSAPTFFQ